MSVLEQVHELTKNTLLIGDDSWPQAADNFLFCTDGLGYIFMDRGVVWKWLCRFMRTLEYRSSGSYAPQSFIPKKAF